VISSSDCVDFSVTKFTGILVHFLQEIAVKTAFPIFSYFPTVNA